MSDVGNVVLVLDPDAGSARFLEQRLAGEDLSVTALADVSQGVNAARSNHPWMVIVSGDSPEGLAVCDALKSDPALAEVPVVVVSEGLADPTQVAHWFAKTPADLYVRRPLAGPFFGATLERLLARRRVDAEEPEVVEEAAPPPEPVPAADDGALAEGRAALTRWEAELTRKELALGRQTEAAAEQAQAMEAREAELTARIAAAQEAEAGLSDRESALADREGALADREGALADREGALAAQAEAAARAAEEASAATQGAADVEALQASLDAALAAQAAAAGETKWAREQLEGARAEANDLKRDVSRGQKELGAARGEVEALAAALAEGLVARARNILDAKLELIRHPEIQLVVAPCQHSKRCKSQSHSR